MANSRPTAIVDISASVPEVGFFSFYATANTGTFSGNLYDSDGVTVGTYAASALVSGTNYSVKGDKPRAGGTQDASMLGTITFGSTEAGGPNVQDGKYTIGSVAYVQIPQAIAATLRYTTGYQQGLVATASSPLLTDSMIAIGRGNIPSGGSTGGGGGGGGGGVGGAATIADGADVTEGAIADAAVAAGAAGTVSAKLRRLTADVGSVLANQTNGTQQGKVTNGTNIADVIAADAGMNALVTAVGDKLVGGGISTWSGTGTTLALAAIDTAGFQSYELHTISVGTGVTNLAVQTADIQAGTFLTQQGINIVSGVSISVAAAGVAMRGPIHRRWLQLISNANQTAPSTTYYLSLSTAPYAANVIVSGSVAASSCTGAAANGASISGSPLTQGLRAQNAEITPVANGQSVYCAGDLAGKAIVMPYANKENFVKGTATATGTSDTSLIAAGGAGLKIYITSVSVYNSGASATVVTLKDGSGGATLWQTIAAAGGGSNFNLLTPVAGTAATALFFASGTSTTTLGISASGYLGT